MTPLERLLAEHEISRLIKRFALLNDAGDWAAVADSFTPNGRFVRPSGGDVIVGPDAIRASLESRLPRKSCHLITNILVDLASLDAGVARCSMLLYTAPPGQAAASVPALIGGFRDKVVRMSEGWRFAERIGFLDLKVGPE